MTQRRSGFLALILGASAGLAFSLGAQGQQLPAAPEPRTLAESGFYDKVRQYAQFQREVNLAQACGLRSPQWAAIASGGVANSQARDRKRFMTAAKDHNAFMVYAEDLTLWQRQVVVLGPIDPQWCKDMAASSRLQDLDRAQALILGNQQ